MEAVNLAHAIDMRHNNFPSLSTKYHDLSLSLLAMLRTLDKSAVTVHWLQVNKFTKPATQ